MFVCLCVCVFVCPRPAAHSERRIDPIPCGNGSTWYVVVHLLLAVTVTHPTVDGVCKFEKLTLSGDFLEGSGSLAIVEMDRGEVVGSDYDTINYRNRATVALHTRIFFP